mgnify:CR=1 FL=1
MRNLSLTEAEETALVNLFLFVHDLGVPPHLENDEAALYSVALDQAIEEAL